MTTLATISDQSTITPLGTVIGVLLLLVVGWLLHRLETREARARQRRARARAHSLDRVIDDVDIEMWEREVSS